MEASEALQTYEKIGQALACYRRTYGKGKADRWPNPELLTANEVRINKREIFQSFLDREISSKEQFAWFVRTYLGFDMPDRAVCPGHIAPLDVIWTLYHDRPPLALWISNRGSGKTRAMSILNMVNLITRPSYETAHTAAIQSQALRAYNYFRQYLKNPLLQTQLAAPPTQSRTQMLNASILETIVATWSGVNCVSGNTFIDLPRDLEKFPDGIKIEELAQQFSGLYKPIVYTYAWEENEKRLVIRRIKNVWQTGVREVWKLKYKYRSGEDHRKYKIGTLIATPDHPIYVNDKGWIALQDLKFGDSLAAFQRYNHTVLSIRPVGRNMKVYDMEVEGAHSFVANGIIVHNSPH